MTIRDLKVNERGTFRMMLVSVQQKDSKGGPYCVLSLKPSKKDSEIEAKMWNCERAGLIASVPEMSVVNVVLTCGEYNGSKNYVASSITAERGADVREFIESSEFDSAKMYDCILKTAGSKCFDGTPEQAVARALYSEFRERLLYWPAAVNVHHNYVGGLITHMGVVAHNVIKFNSAASPEVVRKISGLTPEQLRAGILEFCRHEAPTPSGVFSAAAAAFEKKAISPDAPVAMRRKYLALSIADKLTKSYKYVNREILFSAMLYRDIHSITADPAAAVIGGGPADVLSFRKDMSGHGFAGSELVRVIEHGILVDIGNSLKPITAEAFLGMYAEKLASVAIMYKDAGFNLCTAYMSAVVHDIGKLSEYEADQYGNAEFGVNGHLYGHSMIGIEMVLDCADRLGIDKSSLAKMLNCIASHHDKKEWGALTAPACEEAEVVAVLDYIDSRLDVYHRRTEASEPGTVDNSALRSAGVVVYKAAI